MKPKNKRQREVVRLSRRLSSLTEKQAQYAYRHCFHHYGLQRADGTVICTECGHSWREKHAEQIEESCGLICPECGQELELNRTRKRKVSDRCYYEVITVCGGYQVIRYFLCDMVCMAGEAARYSMTEVFQLWIHPSGKMDVIARKRAMYSYYYDSWSLSSDMDLRSDPDEMQFKVSAMRTYPNARYIPNLKRNGFVGDFHGLLARDLFPALLSDSCAETLIKSGQYFMLYHYISHNIPGFKDRYWPSICICIRNGYTIHDVSLFCDMVDMLSEIGRDVRNPKYICPENLPKAHDRVLKICQEKRRREELERMRNELAEAEETYRKAKHAFFGLVITDGTIDIKVLESVESFFEEGEAMHHCVFENRYYSKKDSLILSATIGGKRIETVEVSLKKFDVVQSRGVNNTNTDYHNRIVELVRGNMGKIRTCMRTKKRKAKTCN